MDVAEPAGKQMLGWMGGKTEVRDVGGGQSHDLSPGLYGDAMMRLHEVQVRVAPVLRGAIAGASTAAVAQVVPSSVGIAPVIIPGSDRSKAFRGDLQLLQRLKRVVAAHLTSLSSCASAGGSCRVSAG